MTRSARHAEKDHPLRPWGTRRDEQSLGACGRRSEPRHPLGQRRGADAHRERAEELSAIDPFDLLKDVVGEFSHD